MIRTARAWLIAALLLAALLPQPAAAQRPDIRVSPPDPVTHDIPAGAKIQSAATLGNRTLVVWGTTRGDGDTIASTLRMQILNGSSPTGDQLQLSSDSARPGRFVQVVAFDTSFAVIWNDYRVSNPGMYIRFVGGDGKLVGSERRISTGYAVPDQTGRILVLGNRTGRLLIWQDNRAVSPGLYGVRVVEGTGIISPDLYIGTSIASLLTYQQLPGWTLIDLLPGGWMAVDEKGQIDPRTLTQAHFSNAFYLNADTSLVSVSGDTLLFFASIFDSQPEKVLKVGALDSATGNTVQLGRDSTGTLVVYFSSIEVTGSASTPGYINQSTYRVHISTTDSISLPEVVLGNITSYWNGGCLYESMCHVTRFKGASMSPGCDNSSRVLLNWEYERYYHSILTETSSSIWTFSVDPLGNFDRNGRGYLTSCLSPSSLAATRLADSTASTVSVSLIDTAIVLRAVTAPWELAIDQIAPAIYLANGLLMTTWQQTVKSTSFNLSEWEYESGNPATLEDEFPDVDDPKSGGYSQQITVNQHGYVTATTTIINPSGMSGVSSHKHLRDVGEYHTSPISSSPVILDWTHYAFSRAGIDRWIKLLSFDDQPDPYALSSGSWRMGLPQLYDLNTGIFLVEVSSLRSWDDRVLEAWLYAFASNGTELWKVDQHNQAPYGGIYLPVDSTQFIRFINVQAETYQNGTIINQFTLPDFSFPPQYQRLLGSYFLRRYWLDSVSRHLRLEIYTLDGILQNATTLLNYSHSSDIMILQRPVDSSLIIISGGEGGVHLTALDKHLTPLVNDLTISATHEFVRHPSALFRNDTLYFIWQDNRNGNGDIYGNGIAWSSIIQKTGDTPAVTTATGPQLIPNPANVATTVELDINGATEVRVELFDLLGAAMAAQTINAVERGRVALQFDLQGLPAGVYMVRYRTATTAGAMPLQVVR
jgi:hypothetical protein